MHFIRTLSPQTLNQGRVSTMILEEERGLGGKKFVDSFSISNINLFAIWGGDVIPNSYPREDTDQNFSLSLFYQDGSELKRTKRIWTVQTGYNGIYGTEAIKLKKS